MDIQSPFLGSLTLSGLAEGSCEGLFQSSKSSQVESLGLYRA